MPKVTVFTPTYNRANTLERLWNSLMKQDSWNFEWLIVDDGSTDDTKALVERFILQTSKFDIRYYKKDNGGKHRAINFAVPLAKGELFFIVDSDDWLPTDSLSTVEKWYSTVEGKQGYAGVAGCKYDSRNILSGTSFNGEYIDATSLERNKHNIRGEKAEVFLTSILNKYPFPEFNGENFLSEAVVWNKIANDGYKIRWFNHNIYYFEYQNDGLTNNLKKLYKKNPVGYLTYISQEIDFHKPSFLTKMLWCGSCFYTVDKILDRNAVVHYLKITKMEGRVARLVYKLRNGLM